MKLSRGSARRTKGVRFAAILAKPPGQQGVAVDFWDLCDFLFSMVDENKSESITTEELVKFLQRLIEVSEKVCGALADKLAIAWGEMALVAGLQQAFKGLDTNGNGELSLEEVTHNFDPSLLGAIKRLPESVKALNVTAELPFSVKLLHVGLAAMQQLHGFKKVGHASGPRQLTLTRTCDGACCRC